MAEDGSTMIAMHGVFVIKSLIPKPNANPLALSLNEVEYWDVLNFLTKPNICVKFDEKTNSINFDITSIVNRYEELLQENEMLFIPYMEKIANTIIFPLKNAKACYMVGNYLGTVSLCGMICEMLITLIYDMNRIYVNERDIESNNEIKKIIFNGDRSFEELYQDQKIRICKAFGLIDDENKSLFNDVKTIRNKYLHLFSKDYNSIQNDAKDVYFKTYKLLQNIVGYKYENGLLSFDVKFESYLKSNDIIQKPIQGGTK